MIKEILTKAAAKDFNDAVCDEYGLYYSKDYKRLLSYKNPLFSQDKRQSFSSIIIHPKTKIICEDAFRDYGTLTCHGFLDSVKTKLILPEGLEIIGNNAFTNSGISHVLIPKSVNTIYGNPFAFSRITEIENYSDFFKIKEGILYNENFDCLIHCFVQIESFISYSQTTCIRDGAFSCQLKLKSVILSNIEQIGNRTFYNCPNLEYIRFSEKLKTIGDEAFKNKIESSFFDEAEIESFNRTGKRKLVNDSREIIIPFNTEHIGKEAFPHITNIKSNSPNFIIDSNFLLSADGKILFNCLTTSKTVVIPESVEFIMGEAFEGCQSIERLIIPDNVKYIGNRAFRYCYELKSVYFESHFIELGEYVFSDCIKLKNITLPLELKKIPNGTFYNCPEICNNIFPNSVTIIGEYACSNCGFKELTMPKELITIGEYAFENCRQLHSLTLNDKIEIIGSFAFSSCDKIEELCFPKSLKEIGCYSFKLHNKVKISNRLMSIDDNGLGGDWHELIIYIPTQYVWDMVCYNEIKNYQHIVPSFKKWTLEERLSGLDLGTFSFTKYNGFNPYERDYNKPGLYSGDMECFISLYENYSPKITKKIVLDKRVKYVCNSAFVKSDCGVAFYADLGEVFLPDTIIAIGNNAFEFCGIKKFKLPELLEYIGDFSFKNTRIDNKIIIPKKVSHIGMNPFACDFIESYHLKIECHSPFFKIVDNILYTNDMKRLIYCFNFNDYIIIPDKVETIDDYAFSYLPTRNITIPSSVKWIGNHAFAWCNKLEKINLTNVRFIGKSCFCGCESLKKVTMPNSEIINASMFEYCNNLKTVKINFHTKKIDSYAFKNCPNLTKILLPPNITEIGEAAFLGSGIKKIVCESTYFEIKDNMLFTKGLRTLIYCFNKKSKVIVPEGVIEISNEAFANRKEMNNIRFPSSLLKLGERVFSGCSNLKLIDLSITEIQKLDKNVLACCGSKPQIKIKKKEKPS